MVNATQNYLGKTEIILSQNHFWWTDKYFIVVHTLVSSWLWTNKNGEPIS